MAKTAIIFVIIYFSGIIGTIAIDATYGVYLYELTYFVTPKIRWWSAFLPDIRFSFIIAISILIGFAIRNKNYSANRVFDVPQSKWLLALVILLGLISFIAVWPEKHWEQYTRFLKLMAFVFFVYKLIDTPKKFERMIYAYLLGMFYLSWVAHSTGRYGDRLEGLGPMDARDANGLASVFVTSIPILLFYLIEGKKYWQKISSLIILAFVIDGIVLVNSRGAFIGVIVSVIYLSYFNIFSKMKNFKFKVKWVAGLICGIALFLYLTDAAFWDRMSTMKHSEGVKTSETEGGRRINFWITGLDMVKDHPFGAGAWGYTGLSSQYLPKEWLTKGSRSSHSTWIEALVEFGYLGFILFVCFIISCFNLNRKVRRHLIKKKDHYLFYQNVAMNAGFVALLTTSTFLDRFHAEMMYWFPAFMACFANIYLCKDSSSNIELVSRKFEEKSTTIPRKSRL